jgi:hypothetical protein
LLHHWKKCNGVDAIQTVPKVEKIDTIKLYQT